ncbi:cytochrome ubiquinol oxidase subunit I [Bacillus sp. 165]|uniref:cytochrome ubiquinol oxidase subunit I n=1 Tax=Bacillus sp. 165 TaxID=1529117 RepID=UPI001ADB5C93|nr:cytochrome ubiquinol oxidase subunit I [Bacillus sp. 165]MBO9130343.1 cytochrome ubiquinol oxidase subunit I [Bacillus sp. 165]
MSLDSVTLSRGLTELTLAFHIIFATIGVGVPVMISLAELYGIKKKDSHYILLARRWTRGFTITVAVGVVTGTCIGLQLSLLWPSFMQLAGQAIALPLFMETFAFFFEAIFLGIYLYTWDRFKKPIFHWLLSIPVIIGSTLSAFFITVVNAFMNTPQGFKLEDGRIVDLQPLVAMFNPATPTKTLHVIVTAYLTSAFVLAAITAFMILKGKRDVYYQKALKLTMVACAILGIATGIAGDLSAKFLAKYQPEKLAAAEWHFETERGADLVLFGILDEKTEEIKYEIRIPKFLSFLAGSSFDTKVTGLNETPQDERPPLYIHYLFDLKITFAMYLVGVAFLFLILVKINAAWAHNKWMLRSIIIGGPLSMLTIEIGWFFAEVGRQPWILRGYMKVGEGATTAAPQHIGLMFILFMLLYIVLGWISAKVLLKMFKTNPAELELEKHIDTKLVK